MTVTTPTHETCQHPAGRLFAWLADDPSGPVLCVGCCDCGQVLQGAAEQEEVQP